MAESNISVLFTQKQSKYFLLKKEILTTYRWEQKSFLAHSIFSRRDFDELLP